MKRFQAFCFLLAIPIRFSDAGSDDFIQVLVNDISMFVEIHSGKSSHFDCLTACFRFANCSAFYVKTDFTCRLIFSSWKENPVGSTFVWAKVRRFNPSCNEEIFPFLRGRSRYSLSRQNFGWDDSNHLCKFMGGKLAQISSSEEMNALTRILRKADVKGGHVGLRQLPGSAEPKQGWVWEPSGQPSNFVKWMRGNPDNYDGNEHVSEIQTKSGRLNDINIHAKRNALCECFIF